MDKSKVRYKTFKHADLSVWASPQLLALAAAKKIAFLAEDAISQRGCFKIVLAGGNTPKMTYEALIAHSIDLSDWHIYLGDERYLPPSSYELNSQMVERTLLSKTKISPKNIHFFDVGKPPARAAYEYQSLLQNAYPFDLVMLGIGGDGHTASLFPGTSSVDDSEMVLVVNDAPKSPSTRLTMSFDSLSNNRNVMLLASGLDKCVAVSKLCSGGEVPAFQVLSRNTPLIYLDKDAASLIPSSR